MHQRRVERREGFASQLTGFGSHAALRELTLSSNACSGTVREAATSGHDLTARGRRSGALHLNVLPDRGPASSDIKNPPYLKSLLSSAFNVFSHPTYPPQRRGAHWQSGAERPALWTNGELACGRRCRSLELTPRWGPPAVRQNAFSTSTCAHGVLLAGP